MPSCMEAPVCTPVGFPFSCRSPQSILKTSSGGKWGALQHNMNSQTHNILTHNLVASHRHRHCIILLLKKLSLIHKNIYRHLHLNHSLSTQPVSIPPVQLTHTKQRELFVWGGGGTSNEKYSGLALSENLMKPIIWFRKCPVFSWQTFTSVSFS